MLPLLMQGIKGVEKFLLCLFFAGQKLNIINKKNVNVPVFHAKAFAAVVPNGINEFIRKLLGGYIKYSGTRVMLQNIMADRMHQMCFAETDAPV